MTQNEGLAGGSYSRPRLPLPTPQALRVAPVTTHHSYGSVPSSATQLPMALPCPLSWFREPEEPQGTRHPSSSLPQPSLTGQGGEHWSQAQVCPCGVPTAHP